MRKFMLIIIAATVLGSCAKFWTREDFAAIENKTFVVSKVELTVTGEYGTRAKIIGLANKDRFTQFFLLPSFCSRLEDNFGIVITGQNLLERDNCYYEYHDTLAREYHQINWTNSVNAPNRVEFILLEDLYHSACFYVWIDLYATDVSGKSIKVESFRYSFPQYDEGYNYDIDEIQWYQSLSALPYIVYKLGNKSVYLDGSPVVR